MIAKKYRFHSRGGVRYTYKNGQRIRSAKLSLIFNQNSRNKQRFAVVVSKKVLKSAVKRNRIRRRVYEIIRFIQPKITQPIDCIFIVNTRELLTLETKQLRQQVTNLLSEAHLI